MFIDASVIVAILGREPGYEELEKRLAENRGGFYVSPLVLFEASLGLARQKSYPTKPTSALIDQARLAVLAFLEAIQAEGMPITSEIGALAIATCATYGKAVGHLADLNFGDGFAYACAKANGVPLLYKGHDFIHTDMA